MTTSTSEIVINGVRLDISSPEISTRLVEKMKLGFYEAQEAKRIKTAAQKGDRLLQIGAGLGFLSCIAAQTQLFEAITVVEANPQLIGTIKRNHQINNAECDVLNVVLSPEPVQAEATAPFYVRRFLGELAQPPASALRSDRPRANLLISGTTGQLSSFVYRM